MGGRRDWRKEGRKGRERGGTERGRGGTCSKVLGGGIDAPDCHPMYSEFLLPLVR